MNSFEGVRVARPDEVDAIYNLLLELHAENGLFTLDPAKSRKTIVDLLDPSRGVIGVIEGPNGLEGSIGLFLTAWYYTTDLHLSEFWNFVKPECRRSTHAKRLIEFGKWVADDLGVPLHMGIVTTSRAEAKMRLYRRQLKQVGGYFLHGIAPRLNAEIDDVVDKDAAQAKLLEDYHGAAKRVVLLTGDKMKGRPSKQRKAEEEKAMHSLHEVYTVAEVVLNGSS